LLISHAFLNQIEPNLVWAFLDQWQFVFIDHPKCGWLGCVIREGVRRAVLAEPRREEVRAPKGWGEHRSPQMWVLGCVILCPEGVTREPRRGEAIWIGWAPKGLGASIDHPKCGWLGCVILSPEGVRCEPRTGRRCLKCYFRNFAASRRISPPPAASRRLPPLF
jgi:hypothetical protein